MTAVRVSCKQGAKIGWLERRTGITEVMSSSLIQACFFFLLGVHSFGTILVILIPV